MNHESEGNETPEPEDLDDGAPADAEQDEQKPGDASKKAGRDGTTQPQRDSKAGPTKP